MNCKMLRKTYDPSRMAQTVFHDHLVACCDCREYVKDLRQLHSLLSTEPQVSVPRDFDIKLQRRLEQVKRNPLHWWQWASHRYVLPMAAMALVAVTTVVMINRSKDVSGPSPHQQMGSVKAPAVVKPTATRPEDVSRVRIEASEAGSPELDQSMNWSIGATPRRSTRFDRQPVESLEIDSSISETPQVILRIRDDTNREERLVTIPSVVFGAESVFASTRPSHSDLDNVY